MTTPSLGHSPFPWTLDNDGDLVDSTGALVLFTEPVRTDWPCQHTAANTALVEAIGPMLEALQMVWSDAVVRHESDGGQIFMSMRALDAVEAAIEKATRS